MIARISTLTGLKGKMWLLPTLALPVMVLVGCGGSSNGGVFPNPTATAVPTTVPTSAPATIVGQYRGVFSGDASGFLALRINSNRTISGTLSTNTLRPQNALGIGKAAVYTGSGTVNNNGNFSVPFTVGSTTVTFTGRVSTLGNTVVTQSLTWASSNGQNGNYTLETVIGGTPNPTTAPNPTAIPGTTGTPRPTATSGGNTGACTTGRGSATFSNVSANIDSTPISNGCANGAITRLNGNVISATLGFADARGGKARAVAMTVLDPIGGVTAGRTYNIGSNIALYSEVMTGGSQNQWLASSGTIRVTAISGNTYTMEINANFAPSRVTPGATGTFTLQGSGTGTLTPQ